MAKKISRTLIAASAAVISAIYAAGYFITRQDASDVVLDFPSEPPNIPGESIQDSQSETVARSQEFTQVSEEKYQDGAYRGLGKSRFGDIEAEVVIQNGAIISARVSGITTSFPTFVIAPLPSQVVTRQSDRVDIVTGATASSVAFQDAVTEALKRAEKGKPSAPSQEPSASLPFYNYKDGIYSGIGQAFSSIRTDLTIVDGRIVSAEITLLSRTNPFRSILKQLFTRAAEQVIERQTSGIDIVSGATPSMRAARESVRNALAQAH